MPKSNLGLEYCLAMEEKPMDQAVLKTAKPRRGRPRTDAKAQVVQRLLDATELLLRDYSHVDLTERKIAAEAGVHDRMIHYYFSDKDGLIFSVIARYCDEASDKLKVLDSIDLMSTSVTRQIFKVLIDTYYAKPWIARILASELARNNSAIKEFFIKRYGSRGQSPVLIRSAFDRLVECGVYDRRIDAAQAVLGMFFMSFAPVIAGSLTGNIDAELGEFKKDAWIDYVADLFDRQLRAPISN
jgi:AcrR family transcriptional regulator